EPSMETLDPPGEARGMPSRLGGTWGASVWNTVRLPAQIALTLLFGLVIPFFCYVAVGALGVDLTPPLYLAVVLAMLGTASLISMEGLLALKRVDPPEEPGEPYPTASAIIACLLPNEAPIIVETIEAFLRVEYPAPLQIILAY